MKNGTAAETVEDFCETNWMESMRKNSLIFSERVGFVVWRRFRDRMWFPV